jgi:inorganic pyrophosphatase
MRDEKGIDEKILAVPVSDNKFDEIQDISDLSKHWLEEIENFFQTYKMLESKESRVEGWRGSEEARAIIKKYACANGR